MTCGSPQIYVAIEGQRKGEKGKYAQCRRIVVELTDGKPIRSGLSPVMKCRNSRCLNREHMQLLTVRQIGALAAKEGKFSGAARRMAIAAGKQRSPNAKLTWDAVREIRSLATAMEGARKYGIHRSLAARIRRNEAWREGAANNSVFNMTA